MLIIPVISGMDEGALKMAEGAALFRPCTLAVTRRWAIW
jgi:hypothetical protein